MCSGIVWVTRLLHIVYFHTIDLKIMSLYECSNASKKIGHAVIVKTSAIGMVAVVSGLNHIDHCLLVHLDHSPLKSPHLTTKQKDHFTYYGKSN